MPTGSPTTDQLKNFNQSGQAREVWDESTFSQRKAKLNGKASCLATDQGNLNLLKMTPSTRVAKDVSRTRLPAFSNTPVLSSV